MKKGLHYGWVICAVCALFSACTIGLAVDAFSVFLPFLAEKNGYSDLATCLIPTAVCLASIFAALTLGGLIKVAGVRKTLYMAGLMAGFGFLLLGVSSDLILALAGALLLGLGCTYGGAAPTTALINGWFRGAKRRLAMNICACGAALGACAGAPMFTYLAEVKSISYSLIAAAVELLILSILLLLLIRATPEEVGLEPAGRPGPEPKPPTGRGRTRRPALLVLTGLCLGLAGTPSICYLAVHYTRCGYGAMTAAVGISVFGFGLIAGKFLSDALRGKSGSRLTGALFPALSCAGLVLCALLTADDAALLYLSAALLGLGFSTVTGGLSGWAADLSAPEQYEKIFSTAQIGYLTGAVIGTPLPGVIAYFSGTFQRSYFLQAALLAVCIVIVQLAYFAKGPTKKNREV